MTAPAELLARLEAHGIRARALGERLRLEGDRPPPAELVAEARERKPELLELLRERESRCGRLAEAVPQLLDCPRCGARVWRPAGAAACYACDAAPPEPAAPPLPALPPTLRDLARLGVVVTLAEGGFDLLTDPAPLRMARAAFALLVAEADALRAELADAPERTCPRCRRRFRAHDPGARCCSGRCREARDA